MEIIWEKLKYHTSHWYTVEIPLQEKRGFWYSRKPIRSWVGKFDKDLDPPSLAGKVRRDNKTLLVKLYLLPRGKFNLMLGTHTTSGEQHEFFFLIQKFSPPSQIKKAIKNHIKGIETEIEKRFNNEWLYMTDDEKKEIVWEDQD